MRLENNKSILEVNLNGGMIPDFHLKELPLNPLNWKHNEPEMPPFEGHFVCFDRWGPPSEGGKANGFVHHGEINTLKWTLLSEPQKKDALTGFTTTCSLPMGGLQLTRTIEMPENESLFFVREEIKNLNKYGRMFNIVQHVTLGPPFLDKSTLFDINAKKGFENKEDGSLDQEEPVITWPAAEYKGKEINLRQFHTEWPRVVSFVYDRNELYAWVTACNPTKNLLLGYLWKTENYPWINFWRSMENNVPYAFGMEFGTTGLHEPFPVLARKGKIFDRNIYDFIDTGEILTKSYTVFLAKIPSDYKGVGKIELSDSSMTVIEKNSPSRNIDFKL